MNVQMANKTTLAIHLVPRSKIWVDRSGKAVGVPKIDILPVKPKNATKHKVEWEAYVIEEKSGNGVDLFPTISGNNEFEHHEGERPTSQIAALYLNKVKDMATPEDYDTLTKNIISKDWVIANIIHSTRPV